MFYPLEILSPYIGLNFQYKGSDTSINSNQYISDTHLQIYIINTPKIFAVYEYKERIYFGTEPAIHNPTGGGTILPKTDWDIGPLNGVPT